MCPFFVQVFSLFDDLVVLADGHTVFHGPVAQMVSYFGALCYACPSNFNPADFLFMEVLNTGWTNSHSFGNLLVGLLVNLQLSLDMLDMRPYNSTACRQVD